MLNTRTVGGHRPRSNAPTPVISAGATEGRQPGSLFSVQLISRGGTQSSNPVRSSRESTNYRFRDYEGPTLRDQIWNPSTTLPADSINVIRWAQIVGRPRSARRSSTSR